MEPTIEARWTAERLASTKPAWSSDVARGRMVLDARLAGRSRGRGWLLVPAMCGLILAVVAIPQGRAVAQDLWFRLFLNRIEVVRVDWSRLPLDTGVTGPSEVGVVSSLEEAEQKVGFRPFVPPLQELAASPKVAVMGPVSVRQTIHVRPLEEALARSGAHDVRVPANWDGVTLRIEQGHVVELVFPGEIQIVQAKPQQMFVPPGFPLAEFAEAAFRSVGLSWVESRAMARRFAANPALLLDIPADKAVVLEEVRLRSGAGLLVQDPKEGKRVTLLYSSPERAFVVSAPSREVCLRIGLALP
jgi:hypothetical protein